MIDEAAFIDAMKKSGVARVAVIDDVFDAPKINAENAGVLLDYLDKATTPAILAEVDIDADKSKRFKDAVAKSDYESDDLTAAIKALYDRYIETLDNKYDPAGLFGVSKGANLENLRPLLTLLKKCASIELTFAGSDELGTYKETHLLFVDFYLDELLGPDTTPKGEQGKRARSASLDRVKALIEAQDGRTPSVILMSSHDVKAQADEFRADIGKGKVFASRFSFINKKQVKVAAGGKIEIEADAGDKLLDVIQSYEFGRALQAGLDCWLSSATEAIDGLRDEIGHLDLKDFAYLVRFRLAQEGQGLLEYLEWFFGECLLDALGKAVDNAATKDPKVRDLNGPAADRIEGAFDGPTKKVAELYHRVRVEDPRTNRQFNFRLGDIYRIDSKKQRIVATMTPDCDLVVRPGGKRRAPSLLTVGGRLKPFDAPDSSVSDFFMLNKKPYNIAWDRRAISSHDFSDWPKPGTSSEKIEFLGTLRALYAQELQRNVLADIGRVGVSVPPAIGMQAAVKGTFRKKGGKLEQIDLSAAGPAPCFIVMGRGGNDKPKAVFPRRFIGILLARLRAIDGGSLDKAGTLKPLERADAHTKLEKMYRGGIELEDTIDFGIFLTGNPAYRSPGEGPWCWLTVSLSTVEE